MSEAGSAKVLEYSHQIRAGQVASNLEATMYGTHQLHNDFYTEVMVLGSPAHLHGTLVLIGPIT